MAELMGKLLLFPPPPQSQERGSGGGKEGPEEGNGVANLCERIEKGEQREQWNKFSKIANVKIIINSSEHFPNYYSLHLVIQYENRDAEMSEDWLAWFFKNLRIKIGSVNGSIEERIQCEGQGVVTLGKILVLELFPKFSVKDFNSLLLDSRKDGKGIEALIFVDSCPSIHKIWKEIKD